MWILFSCDEWKSISSMRVIGIYSSNETLRKRIDLEVKEGNMNIEENLNLPLGIDIEYGFFKYYNVDDMD